MVCVSSESCGVVIGWMKRQMEPDSAAAEDCCEVEASSIAQHHTLAFDGMQDFLHVAVAGTFLGDLFKYTLSTIILLLTITAGVAGHDSQIWFGVCDCIFHLFQDRGSSGLKANAILFHFCVDAIAVIENGSEGYGFAKVLTGNIDNSDADCVLISFAIGDFGIHSLGSVDFLSHGVVCTSNDPVNQGFVDTGDEYLTFHGVELVAKDILPDIQQGCDILADFVQYLLIDEVVESISEFEQTSQG